MNTILWLHTIGGASAVLLGWLQLLLSKGNQRHRMLGYLWMAVLVMAALTSFAIREIGGLFGFSFESAP